MGSMSLAQSMRRCFSRGRSAADPGLWEEAAGEERAQATVEAAVLLPSFLIVLLLALQPICLLYTTSIMESAASQAARLLVTGEDVDDESVQAFVMRRLAAVPDVSIFHEGGPLSWQVELERTSGTAGAVGVSIEGTVKPLPVLGAFASAFGETNTMGDVRLRVEVSYDGRPSWLEGGYGDWISTWG